MKRQSENVECGFRGTRKVNAGSLLWYNAQVRRLSQALAILLIGAALSGLSFEGRRTRLRRELTEGLLEERLVAASELRTLRMEDAAPLLELALRDPELRVQELAVEAAIALRWTAALGHTRAYFESEDPLQRRLASRAEGELGNAESIPALTRALSDARALVREAAAEGLGRLRLSECAGALGVALDDESTGVRVRAAEALATTPGPRATDYLVARSLDRTSEVRTAVIRALAERAEDEPERILPVLAASLEDESDGVRLAATLGLGRARDGRGIETLIRRLEPFLEANAAASRTRRPEEALAGLAALGRIDSPRARQTLVRALFVATLHDIAREGLAHQSESNALAVGDALAEALRDHPTQLETLTRTVIAAHQVSPSLASALYEISVRGDEAPALVLPALATSISREDDAFEDVVVHILARLDDPPSRRGALEAIRILASRGDFDEAAQQAFLAHALPDDEAHEALEALAAISPRPLAALLAQESDTTRARVLDALVEEDDARVHALALRALVDVHPEARLSALRFYRAHLDAHDVEPLLAMLDAPRPADRFSIVEAIAMLAPNAPDPLRMQVDALLQDALAAADPRLVTAASVGLSAGGSDAHRALFERLAPAAFTDIALHRARATLDQEDAYRVLGPHTAQSSRDFAFEETHAFPASITRAYTALVLAREGALTEEDTAQLCALAARREPAVRANAALALATLHARCANIEPLLWVEQSMASEVQFAGLTWFAALETAAQDARDARSQLILTRCAETALEPRVAAACGDLLRGQFVAAEHEAQWVDVVALDTEDSPLALHWVTLHFADGASLAARTDASGRIAMRIPAARFVRLSDPFASVLEP